MFISRRAISSFVLVLAGCFQAGGGGDDVAETSESGTTSTETTTTSIETTGSGSEDVGGGCGDGLIAIDEECDSENLGNASCESLGYAGGTVACTDTCTLDVSGCLESLCGNGIIEGDEVCDGDDFGGATCASVGMMGEFVGGALSCSMTCDTVGTLGCLSPGEGGACEFNSDCPAEAPSCVMGTCWNGSETDPCDFDVDCLGLNSCSFNQCWDGSEGDPCMADSYCSEMVPFCNAIDMSCHDGSEGDPCESIMDCDPPSPFCVSNACTIGEPGSPCSTSEDCVSNSCDLATMLCE